ncbi:type II 3-dehydroquinate dehydratase [Ponticaulis sp.]|uniref:type II 3-dehydroquinate dehydratase n=1 Tax=Ponticaulis sp. TaxID=2020902 RepID=UPI000C3FF96C|nr:type II 3-dehydroquinate dehydratase [Ponticaulis sp.]MAJ08111.1 type II 3-dehydroquinate dehydratase [Ponticaulis sp.]HBH91200.1 type II 3-dehydroquinate dehydratase [Hyphomonadaceae bacterium]HBJ93299.1 type II 3-dehydroquinate dehydratase [Hyphomonadaceae bacterium]|tara:strand:- start:52936 stop:53379 length:444 start_codon:yes stop_codon:yes gene_type:complete
MTRVISCINGPNLNLLGQREPEIYGRQTLQDIETMARDEATLHGFDLQMHQSNSEGAIVDLLQAARTEATGVILNAAAYTHTSVAIHDALKSLDLPVIEVHLSNPAAREEFRSTNFIGPVVTGSIAGLGAAGYVLAVKALATLIPSS